MAGPLPDDALFEAIVEMGDTVPELVATLGDQSAETLERLLSYEDEDSGQTALHLAIEFAGDRVRQRRR